MKKIIIISVSILFALIFIVLVFKNLDRTTNSDKANQTVDVYFVNPSTKNLEPEKRVVQSTSRSGQVSEILNFLTTSNPASKYLRLPSLTEVKISTSVVIGDTAYIYFDETYYNLTDVDKIYLKSAITWSLTSINDISSVVFYVDDEPIPAKISTTDTDDIFKYDRSHVYLNPTVDPQNFTLIGFKLYFVNSYTNRLEAEQRLNVYANPNVIREYYIVDELIKGTSNTDYISIIPKTTKIINIETDNRTCYVNLSEDFISKQPDDELMNYLSVYQIVNSLTLLDNVDAVQIFINSKKIKGFKNSIDLSEVLTADLSIVDEVITDAVEIEQNQPLNLINEEPKIEDLK